MYAINCDMPEDSRRLKQITGISLPVLLDRQLTWARQYDVLPKRNQNGARLASISNTHQPGTVRPALATIDSNEKEQR